MNESTFFVAGDVVNYPNPTGELCSFELAEIIRKADYAVCNFEAPIHGYGLPQPKCGPHLCQRPETLYGLKTQGFDAVLLANNHIMDFGAEGLEETIRAAQAAGLETVGAGATAEEAYAPLIVEMNGLRVGVINACEAQFGVLDFFTEGSRAGYAWINSPEVDRAVLSLRHSCDFVIVLSHAGLEHYNIPQKEWRVRYKHLCALGADAVIGSHPHVPQGYETHGDSLIFYSLGNFYFDSEKRAGRRDATYSVLLKLSRGSPISFEPVFHQKANGVVCLSDGPERVDIEGLCGRLGEGYEAEHDRMAAETYARVRHRLKRSLNAYPFDRGLLDHVKTVVRWMLRRGSKEDKDLVELHMLRNEAYYFAARHALEVKRRDKY
jgi:hypothetical protein